MEWTALHGSLLGRAFGRLLGRSEPGAMAFVRCLTPDVVAALAADATFAPEGWRVLRVADTEDPAGRTTDADTAVELREAKADATLLLVDTERAGAGMDGIYSAAREVREAELFTTAGRLAGAEVTSKLSSAHRAYAERAIRRAQGVGRHDSVSPWVEFDFLCRAAAHGRHPGEYLHLLGLWPVAASAEGDAGTELAASRRFVDRLLGAAVTGLAVPARIASLRIAASGAQRRDLDRFLAEAATLPLRDALQALADQPHLWVGSLPVHGGDIRAIELTSWRNQNGKIARWSGLVEPPEGAPELVLNPDAQSAKEYSNLEVRWKARPADLEKNAVDYRVALLTDLDEELAARDVRHSARQLEKCRFSNDDFSTLSEDALLSARVAVSVVGRDEIERQESEEFVIRFGDPQVPPAGGAGRKVRTFSEGLIEFPTRETAAAVAENPTCVTADARGFVVLRPPAARLHKSFRVFRPPLIRDVETDWTSRQGALGRWRVRVRASGERAAPVEFIPAEGGDGTAWGRTVVASRRLAEWFRAGGGGVGQVHDDRSKSFEVAKEYVLAWTALLDGGSPALAICNTVEVLSLSGSTIGLIVICPRTRCASPRAAGRLRQPPAARRLRAGAGAQAGTGGTRGPASLFSSKNAWRNASTVTWWRSAVRRSCGSRRTNCRIRSAACDALSRRCVRRALWLSGFPLGSVLGSIGSAGTGVPLFADFTATTTESDFSMPFIFGYGFLLSSATPPTTAGWHGDLPGPGSARTCVPGFFDTAGFRPPSPYRWDGCCLRFPAKTSASRTEISFGAQ